MSAPIDRRPAGLLAGLLGPLTPADPHQLARFVVVGCSNFAVSLTIYHVCYRYQAATWLMSKLPAVESFVVGTVRQVGAESIDGAFANGVAYACGTLNSFVWNRRWTFRVEDRAPRRFGRFVTLNLVGLGVSSLAIFVAVDMLRFPYVFAWVGIGVAIAVMNYACNKYWVFRDRH